jgi:branched-chain amino acid transport system ATP-binding protein
MHDIHAVPLLCATALTRRFGGLTAVAQVSLDLHVGQLHAVIGTNGAGKSTLINMLSGEIAPTSGSIALGGVDVTGWTQPHRARHGIGRSYQRTTIFPQFSVMLWQSARGCDLSMPAAHDVLAVVGLAAFAGQIAGSMSHGQKRQLEIAMCLATRPRVLLLDEPLAGMGAEESERMLALLERLKREHAVLLVEHDMDAVFRVADRITVMVNGEVIASDAPQAIRNNRDVQIAYLGDPTLESQAC